MAGMVEVKGLSEFNTALRRASSDVPGAVQGISLNAALIVVKDAVPTIPRRSGRAAKSVQGFATSQGAEVTGGHGIAYFRWLALGGRSGRGGSNVRRIVKPDRYINPAYVRNKDRIQEMAETELVKALRSAGLEVN